MKRLFLLSLFLCAAASARAEWNDVKEGCDVQAVLAAVGSPLLMSKSRSGAQFTWTYDNGAYILFENGRVSYWQPPKPRQMCRTKAAGKA